MFCVFAQISPDLLTLSDRLATVKVLGCAGSQAADRPVSDDRGAAEAVRVAWHPAEVGGGGLLVGGEGVGVGEGGAGQLLAGELASASRGDPVHSGWEDDLNVKYKRLNLKS